MDEKNTLKLVKKVKSSLKNYRDNFSKLWKEEEEAYFGKIWKRSRGTRPYENHVFQVIESEVPILTDSFPAPSVSVKEEALLPQGENLQKAIEWVLKDQSFQLKFSSVVRNSLISAPGFLHTFYDANANNGEGEIRIEVLPWRSIYLASNSMFIEDCDKARIEVNRSKEWLQLNYSSFKKEIEALSAETQTGKTEENSRERFDSGSTASRDVPPEYKSEDMLTLVKTYVRDYSLVPIPEEETLEDLERELDSLMEGMSPNISKWEDHKAHIEAHQVMLSEIYAKYGVSLEDGREAFEQVIEQVLTESPESGADQDLFLVQMLERHIEEHEILQKENPSGGRLKYPNGLRCIESIEEVVLYDGPSRDEHNEIPLIPFYAYRDGTIYGFGETRNILDSQRMQATLQYKEYKGLQRVANPKVIVDQETGLTEKDITNEDGAIYVIPQGTNIRDVAPNSVSPQIGSFNNDRKRAIAEISGVNEVTQGHMPSPNAAAATVKRTQNQAIGRIRLKDRQNQHYSIRRLGSLISKLILQYWTDEKVLGLESNNSGYSQLIFNPLEMQDLEFNIDISEGSMAGIDKEAFSALMLQFLGAGHITFDNFLEVAEIPKAARLREMSKENQDIAQQLEAIQQENIILKGQLSPESLSPEEAEIFNQYLSEQQQAPQ